MRHRDAVALIAGAGLDRSAPSTWLDLGSGDGAFTQALADLIAPRSVIHAIDLDHCALGQIAAHPAVRIETHAGDFTAPLWPVDQADGILMANSLHYVEHQRQFLRRCAARLTQRGVLLFVEYDTDVANRWVPYPVSRRTLETLFDGWGEVRLLGTRPSAFRQVSMYGAVVEITGV
jgi:trans-aconitate methyltransferase